jgi:hypothetical protein
MMMMAAVTVRMAVAMIVPVIMHLGRGMAGMICVICVICMVCMVCMGRMRGVI